MIDMNIKKTIKSIVLQNIQNDTTYDDEKIFAMISDEIDKYYNNSEPLSIKEKLKLTKSIYDSLRKYDILTELIEDKTVKEIMINSYDEIFIDKNGKYVKWDNYFESKEQLDNIIQQIVSKVNRVVNLSSPIVDARLNDGSRVHVVLPPIAIKGSCMTIRKFPETIDIEKLIKYGTIDKDLANFLEKIVKEKYNIFISGGTGSGKTTFLNAISTFITEDDRVITIEDSAELNISQVKNLVSLETRDKNLEGLGEINMSMLIKASLRMNPDRIIVGEVRGKEALDMLQAMHTGHDGSMSTGHANSSFDMLMRLETMVLMAQDLPLKAIRQQIASGIDIIIHLSKENKKKRVVYEISEILDLQNGEYQINKLYEYKENCFKKCNELKNKK